MEESIYELEKRLKRIEKEAENLEEAESWEPLSIKALLKMRFPKNRFLVENLIPENGITLISGQPGCGKSWIALHVMQCMTSKKDVFEKFKTKRGAVLLVDGETGKMELLRRIKAMRIRSDRKIYVASEEELKIDTHKGLAKIISLVERKKISLVVLDPFIAMHSADENTASGMQKVIDAIKKIQTKTAVLIIHHHRKNEDSHNPSLHIRGSSAIHGAVDSHIEVKGEDGELEVLQIGQHKARRGKPEKPFIVKVESNEKGMNFEFVEYVQRRTNETQEIKDIILTLVNPQIGKDFKFIYAEVNKTIRVGEIKLRTILKELEALKKISIQVAGNNTYLYFKPQTLVF
jgi:KaiC/GvpD/RAD55 family RecA-like ATPase